MTSLNFIVVQRQCTLNRICAWDSEFSSFPKLAMCGGTIPSFVRLQK